MRFDYKILFSGSTGNFNLIENIDITGEKIVFAMDIGKPFKYLEPYLYDVDVILISHRHGDHYIPATYKQIRENFPSILVITNQEVADLIASQGLMPIDYVLNAGEGMQIGDVYVRAFENEHGDQYDPVDCTGWILYDGYENILYSTDMTTTEHYRAYLDKHQLKLDTILLEANYDVNVVGFIESMKLHTGFSIFNNGSERHMSKQEHEEFCKLYRSSERSRTEQLHISSTYHDFDGMRKQSKFEHVTDEDIKKYMEG